MNDIPGNTFQARDTPLSPNTRQLVEDFIERMEAIQAEQTQALTIATTEAAMNKAEELQPRQRHARQLFFPLVGWIANKLIPRLHRDQPTEHDEDTTVVIDAPYQIIHNKGEDDEPKQ